MTRNAETVWTFDTPNFRVALEVEPEAMDPADSFEFPEDIEAVRSGAVEWFVASVVVYAGDDPDSLTEIGRNSLGGCAYRTVEEFYTSHRDRDPLSRNSSLMRAAKGGNVSICHYFPDMVRQAVGMARGHAAMVAPVARDNA